MSRLTCKLYGCKLLFALDLQHVLIFLLIYFVQKVLTSQEFGPALNLYFQQQPKHICMIFTWQLGLFDGARLRGLDLQQSWVGLALWDMGVAEGGVLD